MTPRDENIGCHTNEFCSRYPNPCDCGEPKFLEPRPWFLVELRDSDGNDCTVYDVLVQARDRDAALDAVMTYIKREWPGDEPDGSYGTFHPCDCECEHGTPLWDCTETEMPACSDGWDCSHGGVLVDDYNVEEYPAEAAAREARRKYHRLIELEVDPTGGA